MKQILINLVTNAVKYSPPKTTVTITSKHLQETNQIYIEIADQGFGMSEEEIEKYLAGKGKEIDKSEIIEMHKIDSYGIGMPIVLGLIELHNGKIEVESKKGIGTKVKLFFNAGKGLEEQVSPTIETTLPKPVKNKSILLVEDNPVSAKVIIKILQNAGYKTHQAWNGKEALIILDEENFDLILMDGEMPIMNGYETTAAIREGESFAKFKEYKTIPIVALMASSNEKTIKRAMDSGMNYYLEKSAYKAKLLELIERLCSESC